MNRIIRILVAGVVAMVAGGCATQPMTPEEAAYRQERMQRAGAAFTGLSQQLNQQHQAPPARQPSQTNCTMQPDGMGGWRQMCQQW